MNRKSTIRSRKEIEVGKLRETILTVKSNKEYKKILSQIIKLQEDINERCKSC